MRNQEDASQTFQIQFLQSNDGPIPNQSYLCKQMQYKVAACLAALVHDLGGNATWVAGVWKDPSAVMHTATDWRKDAMKFVFRGDMGGDLATIEFSNARWSSDSHIVYGTKHVDENVVMTDDSKTKIIRNDTDDTIDISYDEEAEVTNAFRSSVTKGVELDVTTHEETKVSGNYMGVSAEETLGIDFGVSASESEEKEKSEEGTKKESVHIEFDAKPHNYYLIDITKEHENTEEPFSINGVMDFDITIELKGDAKKGNGRYCPDRTIKVRGISGIMQFVFGYDTNYPLMSGYWDKASVSRVRNGINAIKNPDMRFITVSGVNFESLEDNVDYKVQALGGSIPDDLKHLPVVDGNDVNSVMSDEKLSVLKD